MQKQITSYKIRGLGNVLDPIQTENIKKINIKNVSHAGAIKVNNYNYEVFVFYP